MSSSSLLTPREIVTSLVSSIQQPHHTAIEAQSSNPLRDSSQHNQKALLTLHVLFPNELLAALDVLDRNLVTRLKLEHEDSRPQISTNPEVLPQSIPGERVRLQEGVELQQLRNVPDIQTLRHSRGEDEDQMVQPEAIAGSARGQSPSVVQVQDLERQHQTLRHERSEAGFSADARNTNHAQIYVVRSGQLPSRFRQLNHTTSYEVRLDAWSCSCPAFAFSAFPAASSENDLTQSDVYQQTHYTPKANWKFGGLTLGTDMPVCKHLLACLLIEHSNVFASFVEEREVSVEELAGWAAGWGD